VCSAITLIYSNLARTLADSANEDFRALGHLVQALEKISATELQSKTKPTLSPLDPREVLNHLRIIIEPAWRDVDGVVRWNVPDRLPLVFADEFGLTQAFLNLSQNSLRALADCDVRELTISVAADNNGGLRIVFQDSGPGIRDNRHLFEPFQHGAEHVGLGLYVSRAILRSFGGDLRHEPTALGCRFVAELRTAAAKGVQAA
jgi:C4-dicarboxylate-specific signal transduction histidine kinase